MDIEWVPFTGLWVTNDADNIRSSIPVSNFTIEVWFTIQSNEDDLSNIPIVGGGLVSAISKSVNLTCP